MTKKNQDNSPLKPEDISLIAPDREGRVPDYLMRGFQCGLDAVQRQALGVVKMLTDSGRNPIQEVGQNPRLLFTGFESRFLYKMLATYPSLLVRQVVGEDTPTWQVAALSTIVETLIGAPLEVNSARASLKSLGQNIDGFASFAHTTRAAFLPFAVRNYVGWLVINGEERDPLRRAALGGLAGIMSSPIDSLGNLSMRYSDPNKSLLETYFKAMNKISLADMARAAPVRGVAAGLSAVVLSGQTTEILRDIFNPLYQRAIGINSQNPNPEVNPASSSSLKKDKESEKSQGDY
jgi:hypothetical protein